MHQVLLDSLPMLCADVIRVIAGYSTFNLLRCIEMYSLPSAKFVAVSPNGSRLVIASETQIHIIEPTGLRCAQSVASIKRGVSLNNRKSLVRSMCMDDKLQTWVVDAKGQKLLAFGPEGAYLFSLNMHLFPIGAVSANRRGEIVSLDYCANGNVFSQYGKEKVEKVCDFYSPMRTPFARSCRVAIANSGTVYALRPCLGDDSDQSLCVWVCFAFNYFFLLLYFKRCFLQMWNPDGVYAGSFYTSPILGTPSFRCCDLTVNEQDKGNVLVTDREFHRVLVFSASGTFLYEFGAESLKSPVGIATDDNGVVYVCDTSLQQIQVFMSLASQSGQQS
jgi:hypothetical protein